MIGIVRIALNSRQHRDGSLDKDQHLFLVECVTAVAWPFFATLAVLLVAALILDDVQLVFLPYLSAVIAVTALAWMIGIWLLKSSLFAEMIKALTYLKALRRHRASSGSSG